MLIKIIKIIKIVNGITLIVPPILVSWFIKSLSTWIIPPVALGFSAGVELVLISTIKSMSLETADVPRAVSNLSSFPSHFHSKV